ncbi:MAG: hypothetical protein JOY64_35560 [Alphaproteobacteria bacterium]|nr:hypothetical protein [Alphaproteobacteria bacterium]
MVKTILATATAALASFAIVLPAGANGGFGTSGVNPNGLMQNGTQVSGAGGMGDAAPAGDLPCPAGEEDYSGGIT